MKFSKKIFLLIVLVFVFYSCKSKETNLTFYGIAGTSRVGIVKLFEEPPKINGFDLNIEVFAGADLVAGRFISSEAKIGMLPPNNAAKIYTTGARDLRVVAVTGVGMLSLLSADPNVRSIADLKGRSVEVAGGGATPDNVFKKILRSNGLKPDVDVILGYSLAYPEIAQLLITEKLSVALLPEPFSTMALLGNPKLHHVCDVQKEWVKAGGIENYPMTVLVVDGAFADANPQAVKEIAEAVKNSIEWVVSNPEQAGELADKHDLGLRANVVTASIPKCNFVFYSAQEAKLALEALFKEFLANDPASIGGALPDNNFYLK